MTLRPAALAACLVLSAVAANLRPETLRYSLAWPSGLPLGEAQLSAAPQEDGKVQLAFGLDASLPGFPLSERAMSVATAALCSVELTKEATRGKRTINETTTFDAATRTATRKTAKGGETRYDTDACARDALAYIYFLRREWAAGRVPPAQQVWFGAPYEIRAAYGAPQKLRVGNEWIDTDRLDFALRGPVANVKFEISFARDAVKTPVHVRVPLAAGAFTMELSR
jgi:hypothetical protein